MTDQQTDLKERSLIARLVAGLRMVVDRAGFPATPQCCVRETIAMNVVDSRTEITLTGVIARMMPSCRVICTVDRLLSALMAVLAGLLLVGLLGTQALAHDGHDGRSGALAAQIELSAPIVAIAQVDDLVIVTADATTCDGRCCFSSHCCPAVFAAIDVSLMRQHPAMAAAGLAVDLIDVGPPDGPRRPPKARI